MGLPAHSLLPAPGTVVAGKYRIERTIGEGGMGVVYEAMHLRLKQRVAIKMLLPELLGSADVVSRFEREARASGQLRSPNTARVLDVESTPDGVPFMVLEFLDGHDLSVELEQRGPLPIGEAVDCVLQACNAMREAHAMGIIHRDLKPSNLFLAKSGEEVAIKVLDFGISKVESDKEARVTATQTTVGTPLYMSPEQIRSAKHVDARSDVWSLGIILYELLAGHTPFEGSAAAAAVSICIDPVPSLRARRPDVPPELESVILRALEKPVDQRIRSVDALAAELTAFAATPALASGRQIGVSYTSALPPAVVSSPVITGEHASAEPSFVAARTELGVGPSSTPSIEPPKSRTEGSWTTGARRREKTASRRGAAIGAVVVLGLITLAGGVAVVLSQRPKSDPAVATHPTISASPIPVVTETAQPTIPSTAGAVSATIPVIAASNLPPTKPPVPKPTGAKTAKPPPVASTPATTAPISTRPPSHL